MAITKPQPYPATRIFVGATLYSAYACETDSGIKTGINLWVVRTIRARRNSLTRYGFSISDPRFVLPKMVNLVQKNAWTWGKLSKKTGDYGWQKSIPAEYRKQFSVGSALPYGIYTTERAALVYALAAQEQWTARLDKYIAEAETPEDKAEIEAEKAIELRQVKALQRRLKALKKT